MSWLPSPPVPSGADVDSAVIVAAIEASIADSFGPGVSTGFAGPDTWCGSQGGMAGGPAVLPPESLEPPEVTLLIGPLVALPPEPDASDTCLGLGRDACCCLYSCCCHAWYISCDSAPMIPLPVSFLIGCAAFFCCPLLAILLPIAG